MVVQNILFPPTMSMSCCIYLPKNGMVIFNNFLSCDEMGTHGDGILGSQGNLRNYLEVGLSYLEDQIKRDRDK